MKLPSSPANQNAAGFFLVDLILALGLCGVLTAVLIAGGKREALRDKARQAKLELSAIHQAMQTVDKLSLAPAGVPVDFTTLKPYLAKQGKLASSLATTGKDAFGHAYRDLVLGQPPPVPQATYLLMADKLPVDFWVPFPIPVPKAQPVTIERK